MVIYDRLLTVCDLDSDSVPRVLVPGESYYYRETVIGETRFYAAMQAGARIDMSVEMWRAPVRAGQYCLIDGELYRVVRAQAKDNADGLPVTVLTLRLSETEFPVKGGAP